MTDFPPFSQLLSRATVQALQMRCLTFPGSIGLEMASRQKRVNIYGGPCILALRKLIDGPIDFYDFFSAQGHIKSFKRVSL